MPMAASDTASLYAVLWPSSLSPRRRGVSFLSASFFFCFRFFCAFSFFFVYSVNFGSN
uniref:Uncharacterized protein n=1 Tax=Rhizophora mucronata TaxID=61149 RepID=A0A2P2MVX2_RHIMU